MVKRTETKPPKGTRDFLPEELRRRGHVVGIIREVYENHGFVPLETPSLERLDTLLGKYGEEGDQLVFKILHRGAPLVAGIREAAAHLEGPGNVVVGRSGETAPGAERLLADLGLRYDLTVPLARVYATAQGRLPTVFRRYQIQPVWRADAPGRGRFREFFQCDVDVIGTGGPAVEAELLGAVSACLDRLGLGEAEIRVNHRALLSALTERAGIDPARSHEAIIALDKLDKIGAEGVRAELEQRGLAGGQALLDLVLGGPSLDALSGQLGDAGRAAAEELGKVLSLAEATPASGKVRFEPTLARGLGYYTGAIFEISHPGLDGSLGGGGRYDGLIGMFSGRPVPACGFSLGLERLLVVLEERGLFPPLPADADVLLGYGEAERELEAVRLAYQLRAEGLRVALHPKPDKMGKLKKQAMERRLPALVWLAESGPTLWRPEKPDAPAAPLSLPLAAALFESEG